MAADRMIARVPANAEKNRLNKQLGILAIYCIKFQIIVNQGYNQSFLYVHDNLF